MKSEIKKPKDTYIVKIYSGMGKSLKDVIKEAIKEELLKQIAGNGEGYEAE